MVTLALGLLTLAGAVLALVVAVLHTGAAIRLGPLVLAFPAAILPARLVEATSAPGSAAVTRRLDRQLTSKQAS